MTTLLAGAVGTTPDPIAVTSSAGAAIQSLGLNLSQGPIADLCNQTTTTALGLFLVFGLIALIVEAFGHGPEHRRDYAGIAWRAVVVLLLLKFYAPVFGSVIATTEAIAGQFKPMEANEELASQTAQYFTIAQQLPLPTASGAAVASSPEPSWIGTKIYESSIHLLITLGQAVFWALGILSRIALLLFYVIGPMALVASLPRASHVGTRWFGHYVGVACWPILSALVVRIVLAIGVSGLYSASALGHVCVALALALCALAVPVVSTALVGGSVTTATQYGFKIAQTHVSGLTSTLSKAANRNARSEKPDGDDASESGPRGSPGSGAKPPHNPPANPNNS